MMGSPHVGSHRNTREGHLFLEGPGVTFSGRLPNPDAGKRSRISEDSHHRPEQPLDWADQRQPLPTQPASHSALLPPSLRHPEPWLSAGLLPHAQTHTHTGFEPWPPRGMVLQGGKLLGYFTRTKISLWKISPGSNR